MQWSQRLSQFLKLQKSNHINYRMLKQLHEAKQQNNEIVQKSQSFQRLIKLLPPQFKHLTLYKELIYQIWDEEHPLKAREQCAAEILKIITEWIMYFEVKFEEIKDNDIGKGYKLIREFIESQKYYKPKDKQYTLIIIEEIYEDLVDLFGQKFWQLSSSQVDIKIQQSIKQNKSECTIQDDQTAEEIIKLLQLLTFREFHIINTKQKNTDFEENPQMDISIYKSSLCRFSKPNYTEFIYCSLNYLLDNPLTLSFQESTTKLALQWMRSRQALSKPKLIVNLFRKLMIRTKKAIRLALSFQYIEVYEFFQKLQCYDIIEELQEMLYFRQLIIGHTKLSSEQVSNLSNSLQSPQLYFQNVWIKPGSKQRKFFSLQTNETNGKNNKGILKMQILLVEGSADINLRVFYLKSDKRQELYHEELKISDHKIQLILKYQGLYAVQFDNSYSWIHGKSVKVYWDIYQSVANIQQELEGWKQIEKEYKEQN